MKVVDSWVKLAQVPWAISNYIDIESHTQPYIKGIEQESPNYNEASLPAFCLINFTAKSLHLT